MPSFAPPHSMQYQNLCGEKHVSKLRDKDSKKIGV